MRDGCGGGLEGGVREECGVRVYEELLGGRGWWRQNEVEEAGVAETNFKLEKLFCQLLKHSKMKSLQTTCPQESYYCVSSWLLPRSTFLVYAS